MNQEGMYHRQGSSSRALEMDRHPALIERDRYVISMIREMKKHRDDKDCAIAELSIGEGRLTLDLANAFPDSQINGFDISSARIEFVRSLLSASHSEKVASVDLFRCNFDSNFSGIQSEAYDFLIALDILEHVLDVFGFIENCHRVLKAGGALILRVPNIAYLKHRVLLMVGSLPVTSSWFGPKGQLEAWHKEHGWDGGHLHFFTLPMLDSLLRECGFYIESCRDPGARLEVIRNLVPNLLYSNPLIVAKRENAHHN